MDDVCAVSPSSMTARASAWRFEVDTSITGSRVKAVLERLADLRGLPRSITVDHGPSQKAR